MFQEARNELKLFKFRLTESHLTTSSTITDLATVWEKLLRSHHATNGQQSCQNLALRKAFAAEENMSSSGLFATAMALRLCGSSLHIGHTYSVCLVIWGSLHPPHQHHSYWNGLSEECARMHRR